MIARVPFDPAEADDTPVPDRRSADGEALRQWIDACPNSLYSALVFRFYALDQKSVYTDLASIVEVAFSGRRILLYEYGLARIPA